MKASPVIVFTHTLPTVYPSAASSVSVGSVRCSVVEPGAGGSGITTSAAPGDPVPEKYTNRQSM